MTRCFKVSLLCNLALAGVLISLLLHHRQEKAAVPPPTPVAETPAPVLVSTAEPAEPKPFQWSQLESRNDYREYVANLRAAGCPESTVEDIVQGDAERAFSFQRRKFNLDGSKPGPWSINRQMRLVAFFLGRASAADLADEPAEQPAAEGQGVSPVYPLAFQEVNPDAMGLTQDEKQAFQNAVTGVRQQFINQIGGTNQDPADPAYLARWQKAQSQMDSVLRARLGGKIFMAYASAARANARNAAGNP
jgi:hypothetical protein